MSMKMFTYKILCGIKVLSTFLSNIYHQTANFQHNLNHGHKYY